MSEKIIPPNPDVVRGVQQLLEKHNININYLDIDVVVGAMSHILKTERRGIEYMAELLNLDITTGLNEKQYFQKDNFGRLTREINPESIIFLKGCLVDGTPHCPISEIEIRDRDRECCDSCGVYAFCVQETETDYGKAFLCSRCTTGNKYNAYQESNLLECNDCTNGECTWHPSNADTPFFTGY